MSPSVGPADGAVELLLIVGLLERVVVGFAVVGEGVTTGSSVVCA